MLYFIEQVKFTEGELRDSAVREHCWHINQAKPELWGKCIEVQADMDELNAIKAQFSNLPMPNNKSVVRWNGDLAQFIYDNLSEKHDKDEQQILRKRC